MERLEQHDEDAAVEILAQAAHDAPIEAFETIMNAIYSLRANSYPAGRRGLAHAMETI